jgi:hypothetical protein
MDAENTLGDSTSSILAFDVNSKNAQTTSSLGFVTYFEVQPIPEPSSWALLAFGLASLAFPLRRRLTTRQHGAN